MKRTIVWSVALLSCLGLALGSSLASDNDGKSNCKGLPSAKDLQGWLVDAPGVAGAGNAGGLFAGARMWGAVVNRDGEVCAFSTSTADPTQV